MLPNLMQIQPQMGFVNPHLPNTNNNTTGFNTNFGNVNGNGNTPSSAFMNMPNFNALQNSHMGGSIMGSGQQFQSHHFGQNLNVLGFPLNGQLGNMGQGNPNQLFGNNNTNNNNGQFGWQNQLQNMNQLGSMPLLNPSQVNALTQLLGCANQVAQAMNPQNMPFLGNPQLGFSHPNGGLQPPNFSQQLPVASQQLPNVSVPPSNPIALTHQHGQSSNYQVCCVNISINPVECLCGCFLC